MKRRKIKRILYLTPQLPYPPISGGVKKSNRLVSYLSQHYELGLMCFLKNDDSKYEMEYKKSIPLIEYYSEPINKPRNAKNLVLSYVKKLPLNIYRNFSESFKQRVRNCIDKYDAVFIDHYLMFQYIPKGFKGKIILHQHNAEYVMWQRLAVNELNWLKKIMITMEYRRIRTYEKQMCIEADAILALPNDTEKLVGLGIESKKFYQTYHPGDTYLFEAPPMSFRQTKKSLLYIGTLTWEANVDGLIWFLEKIWPDIKSANPEIRLSIVGKNPNKRLIELTKDDPSIVLVGFAEDLEKYYSSSRVFIAPLRFGSGIKVKVVNALCRGIPTVTTSIGVEGLDLKHEKEVMVADNPFDFAECVNRLMRDEKLWQRIANKSRELMKEKYTWESVFENVEKAIYG